METAHDNRQLSGWKEIGAYLEVTERCAQLWEREKGMPVHRFGGPRGRVYAVAPELDEWKRRQAPAPKFLRRVPRRIWFAAAAVFLAVVFSAGAYIVRPGAIMSSLRMEQRQLVVTDASGRELWRKDFPEGFAPEWLSAPLFWFGDLEGDGRPELLFVHRPVDSSAKGNRVICFGEGGVEKWRFIPRIPMPEQEFGPDTYLVVGVSVVRAGPGPLRVAVASIHHPYYPSQVALLDHQGRLLADYRHSGHLDHMRVHDLEGDGLDELIVAGVNNARRLATLVVLDPGSMDGYSAEPERPKYHLPGKAPAREKFRIMFPRGCINRKFDNYNWVQEISAGAQGIRVTVQEMKGLRVYYHFDAGLRLQWATVEDAWRAHHRQLSAQGLLDHPYREDEEEAFHTVQYVR